MERIEATGPGLADRRSTFPGGRLTASSHLPLVAAVCSDAGPARAMAPVVEAMTADGRVRVVPMAAKRALTVWQELGLAPWDLSPVAGVEACAEILRAMGAGLVMTGTTESLRDHDSMFILAARSMGLPSLALLDFWSHYRIRFGDQSGALTCLPDRIAVMDELAVREMTAQGFDPARLVVTGQPALDALARVDAARAESWGRAVREELGVEPGRKMVLFVSQPLASFHQGLEGPAARLGYDERQVMSLLLRCLEKLAGECHQGLTLMVRPHPRESEQDYAWVRSEKVRVLTCSRHKAHAVVAAADLVVGMHSELLLEACYLKRIVVSLQPGLAQADMLPTNRNGLSQPVYAREEALPILRRLLLDPEARAQRLAALERLEPPAGAAAKVASLAYDMLGLP